MTHLQTYIDGINKWSQLFNEGNLFEIGHIDDAVAQRLFQRIDGDLSPENLCMDGEASAAHVRRQSKLLHGAAKELIKMGYTPRDCYCL